ncbi:DUF4126 domain-containing protein [Propionibacteriaceae bacterium Y1685]|uniref:DUF4126 domain-containing protein n=1 Tax=Microlunatus sp. Y1700 TaxID=3418487 RepID=UPI003B7D643D
MEMLPLAFTSGWASGINAYATVLILGLLGRFAHIADIPEGLQRTDVLIVMAVLTVIELVADKIPYVDSAWDTISTVIRPIAGATIGALMAGANGDIWTVTLAAVGGITALVSHLTKAGLRLAINTSPEPVTNVGASLAGDVAVTGVATVSVLAPVQVAVVVAILLVIGLVVLFFAFRRVRRGWRAFRKWWARRTGSDVVDAH